MEDTETSLDTMADIRLLPGYSELLASCRSYNASWTVNGTRTKRTRERETSLLNMAERFCRHHGIAERDVMWTVGWDSVDDRWAR